MVFVYISWIKILSTVITSVLQNLSARGLSHTLH